VKGVVKKGDAGKKKGSPEGLPFFYLK